MAEGFREEVDEIECLPRAFTCYDLAQRVSSSNVHLCTFRCFAFNTTLLKLQISVFAIWSPFCCSLVKFLDLRFNHGGRTHRGRSAGTQTATCRVASTTVKLQIPTWQTFLPEPCQMQMLTGYLLRGREDFDGSEGVPCCGANCRSVEFWSVSLLLQETLQGRWVNPLSYGHVFRSDSVDPVSTLGGNFQGLLSIPCPTDSCTGERLHPIPSPFQILCMLFPTQEAEDALLQLYPSNC